MDLSVTSRRQTSLVYRTMVKFSAVALCLALAAPATAFVQRTQLSGWTRKQSVQTNVAPSMKLGEDEPVRRSVF